MREGKLRDEKREDGMGNQTLEVLTPQARSLVELERSRPNPAHLPEAEIFDRLARTLGFSAADAFSDDEPLRMRAPVSSAAPAKGLVFSKLKLAALLMATGAVSAAMGAGAVHWSMRQTTAALQAQVDGLQAEVRGWELHRETADLDPFEPAVMSFSSSPHARNAPLIWALPAKKPVDAAPQPPMVDPLNQE